MTARALGFSRVDLMAMPFDELVEVWWPEVTRIVEAEAGR